MQHMTDDMDELFRKAAEEYPLDTRHADWNKIAGRLQDQAVPSNPVRKRYRGLRWLLLLIPLGLTILVFRQTIGSNVDIPQPPALATNSSLEDNVTKDDSASHLPYDDAGDQDDATNIEHDGNKTGSRPGTENPKDGSTNTTTNSKKSTGVNSQQAMLNRKEADVEDRGRTGNDKYRFRDTRIGLVPEINKNTGDGRGAIADGETIANTTAPPDDALSSFDKPAILFAETPNMNAVKIPGPVHVAAGRVRKAQPKSNGFYVGAIMGLDVSSVKLQKFSGVGFHYGGTVGYQFARKLSVEAGFYLSKKYYYTDGKYFDRGKMVVNPSSTILEVDGVCKMFEIPISIKYDIHNTYKSNVFVTGGFSSYIMKEEDYAMLYRYNASGSTAVHDYTYKNSSKNYFAELRLTAGYAVKLPRSFSVRIEPYVNIPVNGVGYGKLNLFSAGVNAGIFKRIF